MIAERLNVHIADGTEGNSSAGFEAMQEPFTFNPFAQLLLNRYEHLWVDGFQLNLGLVRNEIAIIRYVICGRVDRVANKSLLSGQRMKRAGVDLDEKVVAVLKTDQMAVRGNIQTQLVKVTNIGARSANLEQLRMHTACKEMEIQFCDFWPDG